MTLFQQLPLLLIVSPPISIPYHKLVDLIFHFCEQILFRKNQLCPRDKLYEYIMCYIVNHSDGNFSLLQHDIIILDVSP